MGVGMVLDKPPVPGRPANLGNSSAWACCACSGCGLGVVRTFFLSFIISISFFSLSLGDGPI